MGVALELNAIVDSISPLAARAGQPRLPTSKETVCLKSANNNIVCPSVRQCSGKKRTSETRQHLEWTKFDSL